MPNNTELQSTNHFDLLRFTAAGSVDDGKSTLIGRLLVDSNGVYEDQLHAAEKKQKLSNQKYLDLAAITDGLQAEQEQGITIDVAYRYFSTPNRKFIIADTPGHEQYTRNMVTGASTADATIILIDASKGLLTQSKRHLYIAYLLGIKHIIVAVNKMDLVEYDQNTFDSICEDFDNLISNLGFIDVHYIPVSALHGDMIVNPGENMSWYTAPKYSGKTILSTLESIEIHKQAFSNHFRFPVQLVSRPNKTEIEKFRGYMGSITSGSVQIGDSVTILPEHKRSKVKDIVSSAGSVTSATATQSITIILEDELDVSRGDMIAEVKHKPLVKNEISANIVWMSESPMKLDTKYIVKHTTKKAKGIVSNLTNKINIETLLHDSPPDTLLLNEIGEVSIRLLEPIACDVYTQNRTTGGFILIDPATNDTVGAGMICG